jgi:hypothetical protein
MKRKAIHNTKYIENKENMDIESIEAETARLHRHYV